MFSRMSCLSLVPLIVLHLAAAVVPAQDQSVAAAPAALQTDSEPSESVEPPKYKDPFDAYQAGAFDQALQGFVDEQIEHPEDPVAALNVGSAHYGMRNYPEADRSFSMAALSAESEVRQQAMYNLGNSSFRQGRLEEAVELYKKALELDPEDTDAKFNLEYVRDEIRRRHEEAQKRQDQQQQNEQDSQQEQQQNGTEEQDDPTENQDQEQESSEQSQPQPQEAQDTDQDGLSDEVETSGENPTDPQDPDSDDDGLPDGSEDLNQNGRVDPQETDPNKVDSDGDGQSDGQEAAAAAEADTGAEQSESLSPEEAERYLQALEEQRPVREDPQRGRRRRNDKDW